MPSIGPLYAGFAVNFNDGGQQVWANLNNALGDTTGTAATSATPTSNGASTQRLRLRSFGFNVPAGSTITGIQVEVERQAGTASRGGWATDGVQITKAGVEDTSVSPSTTSWTNTKTMDSWGGPTELFGGTFTVADVNDTGFGVSVKCIRNTNTTTFSIFRARITVHYEEPDISVPGTFTANAVLESAPPVSGSFAADAVLSAASPPQFARPDGVSTILGAWVGVPDNTNLHANINEVIPDDENYVESPNNPGAGTYIRFSLDPINPPSVDTGHIFRYRIAKDASLGRTIDMIVRLRQGDDVIAEWEHLNVSDIITYEQALTESEAALITDYESLEFGFDPTISGGGAGRKAVLTWAELEVPYGTPVTTETGSFTADAVLAVGAGQYYAGGWSEVFENTYDEDITTVEETFAADGILRRTEERTFAANAVLQRTETTIFSADARIRTETAVSFTAYSRLLRTEATTFTASALLINVIARDFSANAIIRRTVEASISADAYLLRVGNVAFDANSILRRTDEFTVSANAVIRSTVETSITANSVLKSIIEGTLTANSVLRRTEAQTFTADARLLTSTSQAFSANAWLSRTEEFTFTADAALTAAVLQGIPAQAVLLRTETAFVTANAILSSDVVIAFSADAQLLLAIDRTLSADAFLIAVGLYTFTANSIFLDTRTSDFVANARLLSEESRSLSADAVLRDTADGTVIANSVLLRVEATQATADAYIIQVQEGSFTADARLLTSSQEAFAADASLLRTTPDSVTANAIIAAAQETAFNADAVLLRSSEAQVAADAVITLIGRPVWTTPANAISVTDLTPTLAFIMPETSADMLFKIEMDMSPDFDSPEYREYNMEDGTEGWEYFDGSDWVAASARIPAEYAGNEARFTVPDEVATGIWYRRVTGGV
jgi:hypothetical protein